MSSTYEASTQDTTAPNGNSFMVEVDSSAGTDLPHLPERMPVSIPADQAYFWSRAWQEGEAEALADLEAGRSQTFADPTELARYLLRPSD
jgi:hypothetical protein